MDNPEEGQIQPTVAGVPLASAALSGVRILRLKQVMERTGFRRSWIYKSMKTGAFVPCVKIGRATGWDAAAVEAWIVEKLGREAAQ